MAHLSFRASAAIAWLRLTGRQRQFGDLNTFYRSIDRSQRPGSAIPPRSVSRNIDLRCTMIRGFPCYVLSPRSAATARHVLYLHGGAYVHEIERDHWAFLRRLCRDTGATVTVPIYPLAPRHHHDDTIPMVVAAYRAAMAGVPPEDQIVMGDSAGGGLALVLAEQLHVKGSAQPGHTVLISPWLDATVNQDAQRALDEVDVFLEIQGLREAGHLYANGLSLDDPRISPLNGELPALDNVTVFVGTRDVLLTDARRLRDIAAARGATLEYLEYEDMFHAWVLVDLPEAASARRRITRIVRTPATAS